MKRRQNEIERNREREIPRDAGGIRAHLHTDEAPCVNYTEQMNGTVCGKKLPAQKF